MSWETETGATVEGAERIRKCSKEGKIQAGKDHERDSGEILKDSDFPVYLTAQLKEGES
jgi:hypothetical protein